MAALCTHYLHAWGGLLGMGGTGDEADAHWCNCTNSSMPLSQTYPQLLHKVGKRNACHFSRHFVTLTTAEKFETSQVPTCDLLRPQTATPSHTHTYTYSIHTLWKGRIDVFMNDPPLTSLIMTQLWGISQIILRCSPLHCAITAMLCFLSFPFHNYQTKGPFITTEREVVTSFKSQNISLIVYSLVWHI